MSEMDRLRTFAEEVLRQGEDACPDCDAVHCQSTLIAHYRTAAPVLARMVLLLGERADGMLFQAGEDTKEWLERIFHMEGDYSALESALAEAARLLPEVPHG